MVKVWWRYGEGDGGCDEEVTVEVMMKVVAVVVTDVVDAMRR